MKIPSVVNKLYDDITGVPMTTIVVPRQPRDIFPNSNNIQTYYSVNFGYAISYPKYCNIKVSSKKNNKQDLYPLDGIDDISIYFGEQFRIMPQINVVIESLPARDFIGIFTKRLQIMKKSGVAVDYRSDDGLKLVTMRLVKITHEEAAMYQIIKCFIQPERAFNIVISGVIHGQPEKQAQLVNDIYRIVKSFTFIEKFVEDPS